MNDHDDDHGRVTAAVSSTDVIRMMQIMITYDGHNYYVADDDVDNAHDEDDDYDDDDDDDDDDDYDEDEDGLYDDDDDDVYDDDDGDVYDDETTTMTMLVKMTLIV